MDNTQQDEAIARETKHRTSLWQRWHATTLSNQVVAASTLVIALATLINLCVAVGQWNVLGRQLVEMRNAEKQTQQSFQIDERPYITIDGNAPQFLQSPNTAGIPVSANVVLKPQWSGQKRPTVVRSKPANGCGPGHGSSIPSSLDRASPFWFSSSLVRISGCDRGVAGGRAWR